MLAVCPELLTMHTYNLTVAYYGQHHLCLTMFDHVWPHTCRACVLPIHADLGEGAAPNPNACLAQRHRVLPSTPVFDQV